MGGLLTEQQKRDLVSNLIQEIKETFGVTGGDIAVVVKVTQPTVSNWENKKITAGLDKIALLAEHYGLQKSPYVKALGLFTEGQPHDLKLLGHVYAQLEILDKMLANEKDPAVRELMIQELEHDLLNARDRQERWNELERSRQNQEQKDHELQD